MKKQERSKSGESRSKKQKVSTSPSAHPYETDSQIQNRYGKGRQQSGSDGSAQARGSNH